MRRWASRAVWIFAFGMLCACHALPPAATPTKTQPPPTATNTSPPATPTSTKSLSPTAAITRTRGPSWTKAPTATATTAQDVKVELGVVKFVIPAGLADSATLETTTREELPFVNPSMGPFPEHWVAQLKGYRFSATDFDPRIIIFHADEWAEFDSGVIDGLRELHSHPDQPPDPHLFVFRFSAQIYALSSARNTGIRYLTQYLTGNGHAINNQDIFYYYRGLSSDGGYYISAIMPVGAHFLQASSSSAAFMTAGMIPLPKDADDETFSQYLQAVAQKINASKPEEWRPSLILLDELMRSVQIKT